MGLLSQLSEKKRHWQSYRAITPFRRLPWSSMVSDAPGRVLCSQILGIHLRCWWQQLQGISQGWIACPCLSPEGLTLSAAMAPGCQLASEGLLCPQEAGSRHLAKDRALGFAGKTERQLPPAEQRRLPLLQEEQRPSGKPNTLLGPLGLWCHSEGGVRTAHSASAKCAGPSEMSLPRRPGPHVTSSCTPHLGGYVRIETWMWISQEVPCSVRHPYNLFARNGC